MKPEDKIFIMNMDKLNRSLGIRTIFSTYAYAVFAVNKEHANEIKTFFKDTFNIELSKNNEVSGVIDAGLTKNPGLEVLSFNRMNYHTVKAHPSIVEVNDINEAKAALAKIALENQGITPKNEGRPIT